MEVHYLTPLVTEVVPRDTPAPHLRKNTDKRRLWQDFTVVAAVNSKVYTITVPKAYLTDGSSIPRVFHKVAWHPFVTEAYWAAVVHDYIYSHLHYTYPKEFADNLLRTMIKHDGGSKWMQWCFYHAVRLNFNGGGWNK